MTPHINAKPGEIAKTVLMPGCPIRAKYYAHKYLQNPKLVNEIRNMNMYTGTYKGKPVSFCASGMGLSSMGIYSHELFNFYGVDRIIRIGTCGGYAEHIKVSDVFIVNEAYTTSIDYMELLTDVKSNLAYPSPELTNKLEESAKKLGISYHIGRCFTTPIFYHTKSFDYLKNMSKADVVEMESYALFVNAKIANKQAAAVLTVSDVLQTVDNEPKIIEMENKERERCVDAAMEIALGIL